MNLIDSLLSYFTGDDGLNQEIVSELNDSFLSYFRGGNGLDQETASELN